MVPRGGLKQLFAVRRIGCPTLPKRFIEFQGVFSALSHRFDNPAIIGRTISRTSCPRRHLNLAVGRGGFEPPTSVGRQVVGTPRKDDIGDIRLTLPPALPALAA